MSKMLTLITITTAVIAPLTVHANAALVQPKDQQKSYFRGEKELSLKIAGKIMLGGLFPVHQMLNDLQPCGKISEGRGVQRVEAMLYAMDRINADETFLNDIRLGVHILDTCGSAAFALNQSLDFVRDLMGESDTENYQCADGAKPTLTSASKPQPVAGVIGGSYSSVSVQVANLLRLFQIVQVSPASTNADLSDKTKYEFFARTVPSDNFQAQAMVDIAKHYGWTYITMVYSAGEYGELGANAFRKAAHSKQMCLAAEHRVSRHTELREIVGDIKNRTLNKPGRAETGARLVVLFMRNDDVKALLREAHAQKANDWSHTVVWLASEGWDTQRATTEGIEETARGALILSLDNHPVTQFNEYFLQLHPGHPNFKRNPWLREYWIEKFECQFEPKDNEPDCNDMKLNRDQFEPDNKIQFVVDAVYALATALRDKWQDCFDKKVAEHQIGSSSMFFQSFLSGTDCEDILKNIDGQEFYMKYLLNVTFPSAGSAGWTPMFRFDSQGDGPANYKILNYQQDKDTREVFNYVQVGTWANGILDVNDSQMFWSLVPDLPIPSSICSLPCETGYYKSYPENVCCWSCASCADYQFLANETTCVSCPFGEWPNEHRNSCSRMPLQHMKWSTAYSIVPAVLSSCGIALACVVIVLYVKYSATPVVKASGRELSYILLVAIIICYMMTFILLARPTAALCAARRIGIGLGFSLLYAAMLVKTNRIYRIFNNASNERPRFISPLSQVVITCLLASLQLIGSLTWLFLQPADAIEFSPERSTLVLKCNVEDHWFLVSLCYDVILILLCTIVAVQARKVPENFNEAKFIGFTMYTTCIIWLAFIPIYFGTGNDFQIQTTTLCISISLSATVALFCIFSPKVWIIVFEPDKNVRKVAGNRMLMSRNRTPQNDTHQESVVKPQTRSNTANILTRRTVKQRDARPVDMEPDMDEEDKAHTAHSPLLKSDAPSDLSGLTPPECKNTMVKVTNGGSTSAVTPIVRTANVNTKSVTPPEDDKQMLEFFL